MRSGAPAQWSILGGPRILDGRFTDTQLMMLSQASQRADHAVVLPERLKGGAAHTVVKKLFDATLVREVTASGNVPVWRRDDEEGPLALIITEAGLAAIGLETEEDAPQDRGAAPIALTADTIGTAVPKAPSRHRRSPSSSARAASSIAAVSAEAAKQEPESNTARAPSKQEIVISLLRRSDGASVAEIMQATGWQAHSVRGFLAGTVKKKLGLSLVAEKGPDGERRYRIAVLAEAAE